MSVKEALDKVLEALPEERLREVLDFAEFLNEKTERSAWRQFGQAQLARAYGPDEPDYSSADLKKRDASRDARRRSTHIPAPVRRGRSQTAAGVLLADLPGP